MISIRDQQGQILIEFALCIVVFMLFVFGLIALTMWGAAAYFTQEIAHEVARKYAVTENVEDAVKRGEIYMGKMAYMFIDPSTVEITVVKQNTTAVSNVKAKPNLEKLFIFELPYITRDSEATLEHYIRNPDEYMGRR